VELLREISYKAVTRRKRRRSIRNTTMALHTATPIPVAAIIAHMVGVPLLWAVCILQLAVMEVAMATEVATEVVMVVMGIISTTGSTAAGAGAEERVLATVLTLTDRAQTSVRQCCIKAGRCDLNPFFVYRVRLAFSGTITVRSGNEP